MSLQAVLVRSTPFVFSSSSRTFKVLTTVIMLLTGILIFERPASTQDADFAPFLGSYNGRVTFTTPEGVERRSLDVVIRRERLGFSVEWSTLALKPSEKLKRNTYFATFEPVTHRGFYTSNQKLNRFGAQIPTDPIYAKIEGNKMTIFAYLITADGHHEVQAYERILVPGGMTLNFTRARDRRLLKSIQVNLGIKG